MFADGEMSTTNKKEKDRRNTTTDVSEFCVGCVETAVEEDKLVDKRRR